MPSSGCTAWLTLICAGRRRADGFVDRRGSTPSDRLPNVSDHDGTAIGSATATATGVRLPRLGWRHRRCWTARYPAEAEPYAEGRALERAHVAAHGCYRREACLLEGKLADKAWLPAAGHGFKSQGSGRAVTRIATARCESLHVPKYVDGRKHVRYDEALPERLQAAARPDSLVPSPGRLGRGALVTTTRTTCPGARLARLASGSTANGTGTTTQREQYMSVCWLQLLQRVRDLERRVLDDRLSSREPPKSWW
jgi:hypothetical protein